jgi:hypothetical protein
MRRTCSHPKEKTSGEALCFSCALPQQLRAKSIHISAKDGIKYRSENKEDEDK